MPNIRKILFFVILTLLSSCVSNYSTKPKEHAIIPSPQFLELKDTGYFALSNNTNLINLSDSSFAEDYLKEFLQASSIQVKSNAKDSQNVIVLQYDDGLDSENYILEINANVINLKAGDDAGIFYGVQTLLQLLPKQAWWGKSRSKALILPCLLIKDSPSFPWRGMHIDFSKHFYTTEEIKQILDIMAIYKMNKLHWDLLDAQEDLEEILAYAEKRFIKIISGTDILEKNSAVFVPEFLTMKKLYQLKPHSTNISFIFREKLITSQAQLWREDIKSAQHLQYIAFPRLLALSEVLWSGKNKQAWEDFISCLEDHYQILASRNISYQVHKPATKLGNLRISDTKSATFYLEDNINERGTYQFIINKALGSNVEIEKVELLREHANLAADIHDSITGTINLFNTYTFHIDKFVPSDNYKLLIHFKASYDQDGIAYKNRGNLNVYMRKQGF